MNISNGNSFLHAMGDGAASAVIGFIRFTDAAERVLWQAGEVSSCALRSVVCVQGFEKLAKAKRSPHRQLPHEDHPLRFPSHSYHPARSG